MEEYLNKMITLLNEKIVLQENIIKIQDETINTLKKDKIILSDMLKVWHIKYENN